MSAANKHEPNPIETDKSVEVSDYVLQDIKDRIDSGYQKYGTKLKTHNGRNTLWDAYQEAIDLVMYLRQAILEQEMEKNSDKNN